MTIYYNSYVCVAFMCSACVRLMIH